MKGGLLYNLLDSLSQAEKNQVTRFFNRSVNRDRKYSLLYRILAESNSYEEEEIVKKLYGDVQGCVARFEAACDYVGYLTIEALSLKDDALHSQSAFVRKAIEKKLPRLARKTLIKAMAKAWKDEEFECMLLLMEENKRLVQAGGKSACQKAQVPERKVVFGHIHHLQCIEESLEIYQRGKHVHLSEEVATCIADMREPVRRFVSNSQREIAGRLQLLVREGILEGDYEKACASQSKLAKLVQESRLPRLKSLRINETGLHLRMLIILGRFEEAAKESLRLQSIPANSDSEKILKLRLKLGADFCAAMTLGRSRLGQEAILLLHEKQHLIPENKVAKLYHYAALFMAMEGRWEEVNRWAHLILSLPGKHRLPESWPPYLMLLLAAIELEDPQSASTYLSRLRRNAKTSSYAYPRKATQGLSRLINLPANESRLLLHRFQRELQGICEDKAESLASSYFDLASWIEARLSGKPLRQVLEKQSYAPLKQLFSSKSSA